jgi:hypothetical protein
MTKTIDNKPFEEETRSKILFVAFIVLMFARAYKMSRQTAYCYLKKYGGMDFLFRHWWTLHTEDPYWSLKALYNICYKNGGMR